MTVGTASTTAPTTGLPAARTAEDHTQVHRSAWALPPAETRPVAAVRLSRPLFADVTTVLRDAGFVVFDILAKEVGPAPLVLVLELPRDEQGAERLLAAGASGPGRVLLTEDLQRPSRASLRPALDEIVETPCHPLQVIAAALRVSGAPQWCLARWSERAFDDITAR